MPLSGHFSGKARYDISSGPHIRDTDSISKMVWKKNATLFAILIIACIHFKWQGLCLIALSLLGAVLANVVSKRFLDSDRAYLDGSSILAGLLLALVLPVTTPGWAVLLGSFVGVFWAKEFFGGSGQNL